MRVLCITHAHFEGPGAIARWAREEQHELIHCRPYLEERIPDTFDMLVVMGGPQSAGDLEACPYLELEVECIRGAIAEGRPVLGVCLGAQLIGEALGAATVKSPQKEVGFAPVRLTEEGKNDPLFGEPFVAFHWHGEMMGLPEGAELLASTKGCPHQAFRVGPRVYALQFHLELEPEGVKALVQNCPEDAAEGQPLETMLSAPFDEMQERLFELLDGMVAACTR